MKYIKSIFMLLIISVVLMACSTSYHNDDNQVNISNGKLTKIYTDSNIVIYKHEIDTRRSIKFIYINKSGGATVVQ